MKGRGETAHYNIDAGLDEISDTDDTTEVEQLPILENLERTFDVEKAVVVIIGQDPKRFEDSSGSPVRAEAGLQEGRYGSRQPLS